jgi:hypothetical protein
MGLSTFPAVASPIKSIQRGVAASAGNITISSVKIAKTTTRSFSAGSAGTVAATGTVAAANGATSGISFSAGGGSMSLLSNNVNVSVVGGNGGGSWAQPGNYFGGNPATRYVAGQPASYYTGGHPMYLNAMNTNGMNVGMNSQGISGGTTALATESYGIYLVDAVTVYATGPCRYEVIEYY